MQSPTSAVRPQAAVTGKERRSGYRPPSSVVEVPSQELVDGLDPADVLSLPARVYLSGDTSLLKSTRRVAVVGSRDAGDAGLRRASRLARVLVDAGVVVVSGLARGIDQAAHRAAMEQGGRTIAVIGTPLDISYPAEHAALQEQIYREHLLVSQYPSGSRVYPRNFLARNHLMACISHASVVVEAGETSGSLSQARATLELGRPLFLMRSLLERDDLTWPKQLLALGARVLAEPNDLLKVLDALRPRTP